MVAMTIYIETPKGASVWEAAQEAIRLAANRSEEVEFKFNDIPLRVHPKSYYIDIVVIYNLKHDLRRAIL